MEKEDEFELLSIRYPRVSNSQFCVHILSWQMSVIIVAVSTSDIFRYLVWRNIKHFIPLSLSPQCCIFKTKYWHQQMGVWRSLVLTASCFVLQIQPPNYLISYLSHSLNFQRQIFGILISSKYLCHNFKTHSIQLLQLSQF